MTRDKQADRPHRFPLSLTAACEHPTIRSLRMKSSFAVGLVSGFAESLLASLLGRDATSVDESYNPLGSPNRMSSITSSATLRALCYTIVGSPKDAVLKALGTPPASVGNGGSLHIDDLWYYPLDVAAGAILAIEFAASKAVRAEVVGRNDSADPDEATISCSLPDAIKS